MEELNELKNLVIQTLEANGSLSNIRAQIRSSVFKVIDQPNTQKKNSPFHWENVKCQKLHDEEFGLDFLLVLKEFFQFYNMDYSNCVFASEANARTQVKRDQLIERLGLTGKVEAGKPILTYIVEVVYQISQRFKAGGLNVAPAAPSSVPSAGSKDKGKPARVQEPEIEQEHHERPYGVDSQQFGDSQGYDMSVDSNQLEKYDYYEEVKKN